MNNYKEVNAKNLHKGTMYFIESKDKEPFAAYFDRDESVKYFRFKNSLKRELLVDKKKSKFYNPHVKKNVTRKSAKNNSPSRRSPRKTLYSKKRVEFEPMSVSNSD